MKMRFEKIVLALGVAVFALGIFSTMPVQASDADQVKNPVYDEATDTTDWSYVYFGSYPQTEVTGEKLTDEIVNGSYDRFGYAVVNGVKYRKIIKYTTSYVAEGKTEAFYNWGDKTEAYFKCEPIRWRVLQKDEETLFLLADQVLSCRPYSADDSKVTWEISMIRGWLNGDGNTSNKAFFLYEAFTEEEQNAIQETTVTDSYNVFHGISGGKTTEDKVFLPSIKEVMNPEYGFPNDIISYTKTRRMKPTDYAFTMGAWVGTYNEECYGNTTWMLRSPGSYQQAISLVYNFGHVYQDGYYANERIYGVCPAIKVDVNSAEWSVEYPTICYGDTNNDEQVTLDDAKAALQMALKLVRVETDDKLMADANGDGSVTLGDARLILQKSLKIIEQLPVEEGKGEQTPEEEKPYVHEGEELTYPIQQNNEVSGTIWIAADSIAARHGKSGEQPLYGWGELIGSYFTNDVTVKNNAISGSSTKSFATSGNYSNIMKGLSEGDYFLISFGHNDERCALTLYADPFGASNVRGSYKWNLKHNYIDPALEAGATPVLISPVVRRYFWEGEFVNPQLHSAYATAMKELVAEYADHGITIPYIDLHEKMSALYEELGEEGTKELHGLNSGNYDNTHLSKEGATYACEYITESMREQELSIAQYLK